MRIGAAHTALDAAIKYAHDHRVLFVAILGGVSSPYALQVSGNYALCRKLQAQALLSGLVPSPVDLDATLNNLPLNMRQWIVIARLWVIRALWFSTRLPLRSTIRASSGFLMWFAICVSPAPAC